MACLNDDDTLSQVFQRLHVKSGFNCLTLLHQIIQGTTTKLFETSIFFVKSIFYLSSQTNIEECFEKLIKDGGSYVKEFNNWKILLIDCVIIDIDVVAFLVFDKVFIHLFHDLKNKGLFVMLIALPNIISICSHDETLINAVRHLLKFEDEKKILLSSFLLQFHFNI